MVLNRHAGHCRHNFCGRKARHKLPVGMVQLANEGSFDSFLLAKKRFFRYHFCFNVLYGKSTVYREQSGAIALDFSATATEGRIHNSSIH